MSNLERKIDKARQDLDRGLINKEQFAKLVDRYTAEANTQTGSSTVSGIGSGSAVAIGTNATAGASGAQIFGDNASGTFTTGSGPSASNDVFAELLQKLQAVLEQASPEQQEEASNIQKQAEVLVTEARKEKPDKNVIEQEENKLRKAAWNLAMVMQPVGLIVNQIISIAQNAAG